MKTKQLLFTLFIQFVFFNFIQSQSVTGPTEICPEEFNEYYFTTNADLSDCEVTWHFGAGSALVNGNIVFGSFSAIGLKSLEISFPELSVEGLIEAVVEECDESVSVNSLIVKTIGLFSTNISGMSEVPAGIQNVTYSTSVFSNNYQAECTSLSYSWDLSGLPGWSIASGGNGSTVTLTSNEGRGGTLCVDVVCEDCVEGAQLVSDCFDITRLAPPIDCSADKNVVCLGEENELAVDIPAGFLVASIDWDLDGGATCNPCNAQTITAVSNSNERVTATVTVVFDNGLESTCDLSYWVGKPAKPVITYINSPACIPGNHTTTFFVDSDGATEYRWRLPTCADPSGTDPFNPNPNCWYFYDGDQTIDPQTLVHVGTTNGPVSVWAKNKCGTTSKYINIELCGSNPGPGGGGKPRPGTGPHIPLIGQNPNNVTAYPNPFYDLISVAGNNTQGSNSDFIYNIYNNVGQLVSSKNIQSEEKWSAQIQLNNLQVGLYFLEVVQDGKVLYVDKLIKQE